MDPDVVVSDASTGEARATPSSGSSSPSRAEIDARVEQARQQMIELRRQQDELEREQKDLEDLRQREEEFEHGKAEMLNELGRAVAAIEKEEFDLNKQSSSLSDFRQIFQENIGKLQDIRENEWRGNEVKAHLAKAVAAVESARAELNRGRAQLPFLGEGPVHLETDAQLRGAPAAGVASAAGFDFSLELQRGLARSLPILILGVIALIFWLSRK
ncbi:MAG: hypothetical protein IT578_04720 [Verrucomicrobiae bacterium]|nr:hypothetical protein [Verrucomicrobiae bacterium]